MTPHLAEILIIVVIGLLHPDVPNLRARKGARVDERIDLPRYSS